MEAIAAVKITPQMMAEAFWNMDDDQQAEFFAELHNVVTEYGKTHWEAYGLGEMQWLRMGEKINKNAKSKEMACAMLAWVFNHATDFLDRKL